MMLGMLCRRHDAELDAQTTAGPSTVSHASIDELQHTQAAPGLCPMKLVMTMITLPHTTRHSAGVHSIRGYCSTLGLPFASA